MKLQKTLKHKDITMELKLNDLKELIFMLLVEDTSDIKEMYKDNPLKAYELFEKRLKELQTKTKPKGRCESGFTNFV